MLLIKFYKGLTPSFTPPPYLSFTGRVATGLGSAFSIGQEEGSVRSELCVCPTARERV